MNNHGLEVIKVTVGKGYNDLGNILEKKFETDNKARKLNDYKGYSDATRQFEIKRKK